MVCQSCRFRVKAEFAAVYFDKNAVTMVNTVLPCVVSFVCDAVSFGFSVFIVTVIGEFITVAQLYTLRTHHISGKHIIFVFRTLLTFTSLLDQLFECKPPVENAWLYHWLVGYSLERLVDTGLMQHWRRCLNLFWFVVLTILFLLYNNCRTSLFSLLPVHSSII